MSTEAYIDADGNQPPRPYIHCERPRCPQCVAVDDFKTTRSITVDDTQQQSATCRVCGTRVFIVWE